MIYFFRVKVKLDLRNRNQERNWRPIYLELLKNGCNIVKTKLETEKKLVWLERCHKKNMDDKKF